MPAQPSQSPRLKRFSILGLTMIIIVLPFCLYYLFFVFSQTTYFSNRNLRAIAGIGAQIGEKVNSLAETVINKAKKAKQDPTTRVEGKGGSKSPNVKRKEAAKPAAGARKVKPAATPLRDSKTDRGQRDLAKQIPTNQATTVRPLAVKVSPGDSVNPRVGTTPTAEKTRSSGRVAKAATRPAAAAQPQPDPAEPRVTLNVRPEQRSFWLYLEDRDASGAMPTMPPLKLDLNTLFMPLVQRYVIEELNETKERLFDRVVVAEQETGRVIFDLGPPQVNVVNLDSFVTTKGTKLELKLADQSSTLAEVQLAGTDYKLFLQPVRLTHSASIDENQQGTRWVVCGLTRKDLFRDETFAVSYTVLILFGFTVLLTALSWPFLKLKLMGPKDRMRRADLRLTMVSALLGTALLTFIWLDLRTYFSLENTLDNNLRELSERINFNFRVELGNALGQLHQFNDEIERTMASATKEKLSGALGDLWKSKTLPEVEPKGSSAFAGKTSIFADGIDWEKAPYPYFNTATWTDSAGQQRIKWTTWNDTTAFVDVSFREFFTNPTTGRWWRLNQAGSEADSCGRLNQAEWDSDYCVELLTSRLTGENVAVVATRVPNSNWISNLDTRLLSLMGTVLPTFHGYAVINSKGKVIFHSDERKNLEEEFFAECENDRELRAAVISRTDGFINTKYLGKGHRLHISPLSGTPWMLIVFRDNQAARTMNLQVLTLSLALYVALALLLIILVAAISGGYYWWRGERITWLWPYKERAGRYQSLILLYALLACVFLVAFNFLAAFNKSPWLLVTCCFVLPLCATGLGMFALGIGQSPKSPESLFPYRPSYTMALAGLLALASVLPAWGFFQVARDFELRLMIKHGQVSIAKGIEERNRRVETQYKSIKIGEQGDRAKENKAAFLKRRLNLSSNQPNLDVYDSFFFGTEAGVVSQVPLVDENPGWINPMLAWMRPLYNQGCIESQELSRGASSDKLWRWKQDSAGRLHLEKDKDGRAGDSSVVLTSSIPAIDAANDNWRLGNFIAVALLLWLIYGLVRFAARRFFLLDVEPQSSIDLARPTDIEGSWVYIRSSTRSDRNKLANRWNDGRYRRIDLDQIKDWGNWTNHLPSSSFQPQEAAQSGASDKPNGFPKNEPVPGSVPGPQVESWTDVVLDNFETCLDDPVANRAKLLMIEHLLENKRRVAIVSAVEPLTFSFAPRLNGAGSASAAQFSLLTVPNPAWTSYPVWPAGANGKMERRVSAEGKQNGARDEKEKAPIVVPTLAEAKTRWTAMFTRLPMIIASEQSTDEFMNDHPESWHLLEAGTPVGDIEAPRKEIAAPKPKRRRDRWDVEEQISQVVEQARAYHQALWDSCTEGQRCTLIQLVQDGRISPKNKHLRRLLRRQLIMRDPALRLMDESFRRFVSSVAHKEDVEAWRQQEGGSAWELLKTPLLLILVSVALFLFVTQKEVYDSTITFMSAITGGIALVFRLLGMINGRDKGGVGGVPN